MKLDILDENLFSVCALKSKNIPKNFQTQKTKQIKNIEQILCVLLILTFKSKDKILSVISEIKAIKQYFCATVLITSQKVSLTFICR